MTTAVSTKSFIELQFPVSRLSKESYKERKSNYSQTLTGLGKWWGRKPLVLVRAIILGLLLPNSGDPKKDNDIFLKILTMDDGGLWRRKTKQIPLREAFIRLKTIEREKWFEERELLFNEELPDAFEKYVFKGSQKEREELQRLIFMRLSYDEKLEYCCRPEQIDGPSEETWGYINAHLDTNASTLQELVQQLGERRFGHLPRIGDAFCGGGSIPFESSRLGCEVWASDLNPVATLLTWASLSVIGGGSHVAEQMYEEQQQAYEVVEREIGEWEIETNEKGWRADAYLYCNETICPECEWRVPLINSLVIGERTHTVAKLRPLQSEKVFEIKIESGVTRLDMEAASRMGTVKDSNLICPNCTQSTPISMIRGDRRFSNGLEYGLRMWENDDLVPRQEDVFQERLYCIRWVETYIDTKGRVYTRRHYCAPDANDMAREEKVLLLLRERFSSWQSLGYIPSRKITPGNKTSEPIRTRGWTYWHHLFNPRQLLILGSLFAHVASAASDNSVVAAGLLLSAGKCCDYNARLSRWHAHGANEKSEQVFSNQALNTLYNYGARTTSSLRTVFFTDWPSIEVDKRHHIEPSDARSVSKDCDIWLTDPPYADAIYYHELSEFFLSWYDKHLQSFFPYWYTDSKRVLAISGSTAAFRESMVACYRNLALHMPDDAFQVVMFTHQDASVWAELAQILWASGLSVSAAWCIATETNSALKEGNYVQGTVILVLRKQTADDKVFFDDVYPQVEFEVKAQLDAMMALEDKETPNFGDTDYQLASYAAALRVLTYYNYRNFGDFDLAYELARERKKGEISPVEEIIAEAVKIACDYLVPPNFDTFIWRTLTSEERFYLKGLELEMHGEYRTGAYQELARGFGVKEYKQLFASGKANQAKLKTATEFSTRMLGGLGFGSSLVRNALFAVREVARSEDVKDGLTWLRNEVPNYWNVRKSLIEILRYFSKLEYVGTRWNADAKSALILAWALENDHA